MEDEFAALLEYLGFRVLRKRDPKSGLDIIAKFHGEPIPPTQFRCNLQEPIFSPTGKIAYSLKRGDFTAADVRELLEKVQIARGFVDDDVLRDITGSVMVTNYSKTEDKVDELRTENVYCWDIRRLIFHSIKTRLCYELANKGPVFEHRYPDRIKGSYLQETDRRINGMILINICIFVDDHDKNTTIGYEETKYILESMYDISLKNIIESTQLDIQTNIQFHILGLADNDGMISAYLDYGSTQEAHPRMQLLPKPKIFEYGAAPWMAIYT